MFGKVIKGRGVGGCEAFLVWGIYFTFSDYSERIEDYYDFSGLSEYDRAPDVGPLFRESDRKINSACGHFFLL